MKQIIKKALLTVAALSAILMPVAITGVASAQSTITDPNIQQGLCAGASLSASQSQSCNIQQTTAQAQTSVDTIITTVINIFSLVVGVVSVIMIIIGGLKYITSGGDSGNVSGAKNTILYAIIGLVVVALSQVIVKFVLGRASQ